MRFVICTLLLTVCICTAASAAKPFYVRAFPPHDTKEPSVIVKPLDDPGNPYVGLYSDYDLWAVEHFNSYITPENEFHWQVGLERAQGVHPYGGGSPGQVAVDRSKALTMTVTSVDENGYI